MGFFEVGEEVMHVGDGETATGKVGALLHVEMLMSEEPEVRRAGEEDAYDFAFERVGRGRAWRCVPRIGGHDAKECTVSVRIDEEGSKEREGRTREIRPWPSLTRPSHNRPEPLQHYPSFVTLAFNPSSMVYGFENRDKNRRREEGVREKRRGRECSSSGTYICPWPARPRTRARKVECRSGRSAPRESEVIFEAWSLLDSRGSNPLILPTSSPFLSPLKLSESIPSGRQEII